MLRRVESAIRSKLTSALQPAYMEIVNESYKHSVPPDSESHFKVVVVSDAFEGKSLIDRHRLVNTILQDELKNDIHALSIQAKTLGQWSANPSVASTPNCMGGGKH